MYTIKERISKKLYDELGLRELTDEKKDLVEFKLCAAGVYSPLLGQKITPAGYSTPGKVLIKDPHDKKKPTKMIFLYKGFEEAESEGRTITKGEIDYLRFEGSGIIALTAVVQEAYYFAMLHNKRRDNPNKMSGVIPKFYLVDEARDAFNDVAKFEYKVMAGNILMTELVNKVEVLTAAMKVNDSKLGFIDLNKGEDFVRAELAKVIEEDARGFLMSVGKEAVRMQIVVDELMAERDILWDESKREFFWRKGKTVICHVEEGNKPNHALKDFILTPEGGKAKAEVKALDNERSKLLV